MAYLKDHNASISLRIFIFREEGNLTFGDESFAVQKGTIKFFIKVGFTEFRRIQHEKIFFHRHVLGSFEKRKKKTGKGYMTRQRMNVQRRPLSNILFPALATNNENNLKLLN